MGINNGQKEKKEYTQYNLENGIWHKREYTWKLAKEDALNRKERKRFYKS